jgi:hypothetical protein
MSAFIRVEARAPDARGMSALLQKQTNSRHPVMSASCQKRTYAVQQKGPLFDHLVGGSEQLVRHGEVEHARGLRVDH